MNSFRERLLFSSAAFEISNEPNLDQVYEEEQADAVGEAQKALTDIPIATQKCI